VAVLSPTALVLVNPASRRGAALQARTMAAFAASGVVADAVVTEYAGHAGAMVRAVVERYDHVFTLGGDGTAMEVVDALSGTGRAVGILAGGTGNLLARALQIPLDVRRAVPLLLGGRTRAIDLGVLPEGRRFAVAAGVGIDAAMITGATPLARRRYGVLAYVASATAAIVRRDTFRVRAEVDGRVFEHEHCAGAMIANVGSILNGVMQLGPGIVPDDGALDLCLYNAAGPSDVATLLGKMALRDFRPDPRLVFARGSAIRIETDPPQPVEADGELLGAVALAARVDPGGARVLVPAQSR
jgi:diacylglycerol kinase (ATP)